MFYTLGRVEAEHTHMSYTNGNVLITIKGISHGWKVSREYQGIITHSQIVQTLKEAEKLFNGYIEEAERSN